MFSDKMRSRTDHDLGLGVVTVAVRTRLRCNHGSQFMFTQKLCNRRRKMFVETVSTVGRDEVAVRRYIQEQDKEDQRLDQLTLMPL